MSNYHDHDRAPTVSGTLDLRSTKQRATVGSNTSSLDTWKPDRVEVEINNPLEKFAELKQEIINFHRKPHFQSTPEKTAKQKEHTREVVNRLYRKLRDYLALPEEIQLKYASSESLVKIEKNLNSLAERYNLLIDPYTPKNPQERNTH